MNYAEICDQKRPAGSYPLPASTICLSQQDAHRLPVDLIVYPEDTYLAVNPFRPSAGGFMGGIPVNADGWQDFPRPLGEIDLVQSISVRARYVLRMVVLDYESEPPVKEDLLANTMSEVFRRASWLGVKKLCLDRFELLENKISAYKLLRMIAQCSSAPSKHASNCGFDAVVLSLAPGPCWRRFEMACSHLHALKGFG